MFNMSICKLKLLTLISTILIHYIEVKSKSITLPLHKNSVAYFIPLFLGIPEQQLDLPIDLIQPVTLTSNIHYNINTSQTITNQKQYELTIYRKTTPCTYVEELFKYKLNNTTKFQNISNTNLPLCIYDNKQKIFQQGIGLGYNTNTSNSIIHILYQKDEINSHEFGIFPNITTINEESQGALIFGKITKKLTSLYLYSFSVPISKQNDKMEWCLSINKIQLDSFEYLPPVNINMYFNPLGELISVPKSILDMLYNNYFNKLISEKLCKDDDGDPIFVLYNFICECEVVESFPNMIFYFKDDKDNHRIMIKKEDLFKKVGKSCYFNIVYDWYSLEPNQLLVGSAFIKYFGLTFSYESNRITIYEKENERILGIKQNKYVKTKKWLMIINIGLSGCVGGLIYGLFYLNYKRVIM